MYLYIWELYLIDSRVAKRLAKSWQGGSGHGSGGRGGGGEGGGRGGGEEGEEGEGEGEGRQQNYTKLELRKNVSTIAMPGAGLLLLFWGLQRGYPLWTCFLQFLYKNLIRKSPVLEWDQISGI